MTFNDSASIIESLLRTEAYPHEVDAEVVVNETHISWVLLAGKFAYKIKKPIRNNFLNYSSLALRKHYCEEELRLNQRFAKDIYLEVVAITLTNGQAKMGGSGEPIEYAVRMQRFASEALLNYRVSHNQVHVNEVRSLASNIASFHAQAAVDQGSGRFGTPELIRSEAHANFQEIAKLGIPRTLEIVELLEHWTTSNFARCQTQFLLRKNNGHVRECHGDLHLGNVVLWDNELLPFDGIEFCDDFRWIDTLSDAAFTAMDFAAHGRMDLCHSFLNGYFEFSGDYSAVSLLQWYLVYRAMVRAKVAALRSTQTAASTPENILAERELDAMLDLANRFTGLYASHPTLSITYGLSGSGKTTGSEQVLQRHGAIRVRADVERKRLAGLQPLDRVVGEDGAENLYSKSMTIATYRRLAELAEQLLRCNVNVIIDAACLLKWQREIFKDLAQRMRIPFQILAFHAEASTLRHRIFQRQSDNHDASDADCNILDVQIKMQQHLDADELQFVIATTE